MFPNPLFFAVLFGMTQLDFTKIFGVRKLEFLGYHAVLFA